MRPHRLDAVGAAEGASTRLAGEPRPYEPHRYECPTSSCQATNDDEWGKPCLAPGVLDNCYGTEACGPGPNAAPSEGGGGGGSKKKKKSSNDSLALGLGLGLGLGGLLLIGLIAALCLSKKKQKSTATREQDVENEMVKTGAAMS